MATKSVKRRMVVIFCVVCVVIGFLLGEMLPLPIFDNINLTATIIRPRDAHKRQGF